MHIVNNLCVENYFELTSPFSMRVFISWWGVIRKGDGDVNVIQ